jgi:hypothetical protein
MKVGPYIGFIVLVMVFGSAILGMLIRRKLPESHLSDETQSVVRLLEGHSAQQHWMLSQAQALTTGMADVRWLLIEQDVLGIPVPLKVVLFFCALAVAGAIQTILDLSRPFEGVIRLSGQPLRHAVEVINHVKSNLP